MINDKVNEISVDLQLLTKNTESVVKKAEAASSATAKLKAAAEEMKSMWSGPAAEQLYEDFLHLSVELDEFVMITKKTAEDFSFALSTYKESKQKAKDIINAINI